MAYCTITNVQALNPQRGAYSTTTKPTAVEVGLFITQISNTLDSVLAARGLTVPVTSPAAFASALLLANAQGAAALAEMAMFPEAEGTPGGSPHGLRLWRQYSEFLEWLKKGDLPGGTGSGPTSMRLEEEATETPPEADYDWQKPKLGKDREY